MKTMFAAVAAVLVMVAPGLGRAETAQDRAHIAAIEAGLVPDKSPPGAPARSLAERMAQTKTPGVSIAFVQDGKIQWTRAYGLADVATGRPVTPQSLFQAASISKGVSAVAALRLVEQGKLALDQDVNTTLKAWKVPPSPYTAEQKVTLRGLLSHTAGLNVHGFPGYEAGKPIPTIVQILNGEAPANTAAIVSEAKPGAKWSYSGGGYTVAQLMMTEATGEAFPDILSRLVLKPAGMASSDFEQPLAPAKQGGAVSAYDAAGQPVPGRQHTYPEYAAAGLWTTPSDLGRFIIALQDAYAGRSARLLKQATAQAMMTPVLDNYGLGIQVGMDAGRRTFSHTGGNEGFRCVYFAHADGARQGVVIMTNGDGGTALFKELLEATAKEYGWTLT